MSFQRAREDVFFTFLVRKKAVFCAIFSELRCKGRCFCGNVQAFCKKKCIFAANFLNMTATDKTSDIGICELQLPQCVDERGVLTYAEGASAIPFAIERVFWISDVPAGMCRGGHAHWSCHEALFAIRGHFSVDIDDGTGCRHFLLDSPTRGVVIPAGAWCELTSFSEDALCLVFASEHYNADGYCHSPQSWREQVGQVKSEK